VVELAVDGLEDIEILLLARVLVSLEQLVEDVLGIDKILAVLLTVLLVIEARELVEIVQQLILEVGDVGGLDARKMRVDKDDVLVMLCMPTVLEEQHDVLLGDTAERHVLGERRVVWWDKVV
jgi:hypothetical protein